MEESTRTCATFPTPRAPSVLAFLVFFSQGSLSAPGRAYTDHMSAPIRFETFRQIIRL